MRAREGKSAVPDQIPGLTGPDLVKSVLVGGRWSAGRSYNQEPITVHCSVTVSAVLCTLYCVADTQFVVFIIQDERKERNNVKRLSILSLQAQ